MSLIIPPHYDNLHATKSDGTDVVPAEGVGCTLANSTTYVFALGDDKLVGVSPLASAQVQWDATAVVALTLEVCNFARTIGRPDVTGPNDITKYDVATKGAWMKVDPSTAYVTVTSTDGTTGGATVTNASVSVAGGTAGAAYWDLGNLGARRLRIKVVVTTGGVVRCGAMVKAVG